MADVAVTNCHGMSPAVMACRLQLDCALSEPALIETLHATIAAVFTPEQVVRSEQVQQATKRKVAAGLRDAIPNLPGFVADSSKLRLLAGDLLGLLQSEALNRQLMLVILDDVFVQLFPEIVHDH